MNTLTCLKCGKTNPEHTLRYVSVNVNATSSTSYRGRKQVTTTTTTESFAGVERCHVCDACLKKKRAINAVVSALGTAAVIMAVLMLCFAYCSGGGTLRETEARTAFAVSGAVAVIVGSIVFCMQMKTQKPFIGAMILKKQLGPTATGKVFIPVNTELYLGKDKVTPDMNVFLSKTNLKTEVGTIVFIQFIATGLGEQLVDAMIAREQEGTIEPAAKEPKTGSGYNTADISDASGQSDAKPGAKMRGWVFSCYDHDRMQSLSMFKNASAFYSEGNILKMVRDWMNLAEDKVEMQYIPAPKWNAPDVKATENSFDCTIDVIYAKAMDYLITQNLCTRPQMVAAKKQNMPYPKSGLLLVVLLVAN